MRRLLFPAALLTGAVALGPFLWIVLTSLKSPGQIDLRPPALVPDFDLSFYRAVFLRHNFLAFALNSAIVAGATTVLAVTLGTLAAYPLARLRFRGRRPVLMLVLAASMFPQVAIAGGVYRLLSATNLLNSHLGLILPYTALTLPLVIWILATFFREMPRELEEAASLDGAGPATILLRVIVPLAAPAIFTAAILTFIYSWNEFFFALLIMTDTSRQTLPIGIARFPGEYLVPWGELSAAAVVATAPLVIVVFLLQKRIVSGLTIGAVRD